MREATDFEQKCMRETIDEIRRLLTHMDLCMNEPNVLMASLSKVIELATFTANNLKKIGYEYE